MGNKPKNRQLFSNSKLTKEIGNVWQQNVEINQTDSNNSGPLWHGDPLHSGTHVRNPGINFKQLSNTNVRKFASKNGVSAQRRRRDNSTEEQRKAFRANNYKRPSIDERYTTVTQTPDIQSRNIVPGQKWYGAAIDWINNQVGNPPTICKVIELSNTDGQPVYNCTQIYDTDGDGEITFKDLNSILCAMDEAYCVVDYCYPHCNSWFAHNGNVYNQDCGTDGCGNQCGAWYGTTEDGCAPNGYNGWNYWVCQPGPYVGNNQGGQTRRRYCRGQNNNPPPPSSCFIGGTQITMADGSTKSIEKVEVGELVKTYNENTEKLENNKVLLLQNPIREGYYNLRYGYDDKLLGITDEHPLYSSRMGDDGVTEMGWRSIVPESTLRDYPHLSIMGSLEVGDYVLDDNLDWHKVNSVEYIEGEIQTYNLWSVENTNTFFAGGVLAHNRCFIQDTMILTSERGEVPIQDLRKDDMVIGYEGDDIVENKVLNLLVHQIGGDLVKIYTRKGHITGTKNHPLLAKTVASDYQQSIFTDVRDLSIGDYLLDAAGEPLEIISIEDIEGEQVTYNLEIEGNKTYIANGYRVHNARFTKSSEKHRHQYPNVAIHPMKDPYKEPWRFYDLDDCEQQYIFGFRKHPCPGDKIPAEIKPERVKKLILGDPPSNLKDTNSIDRWYYEQYQKKVLSKKSMRLNSISNMDIDSSTNLGKVKSVDRMVDKIGPPNIPT
tara:strand:+ start:1293 stop:3440 length:2148 start_codon:yes stop_codon:yes gene_type:complete